jgi:hypothetical protein
MWFTLNLFIAFIDGKQDNRTQLGVSEPELLLERFLVL